MSRKGISRSKVEDFEPKRKNPISLGSDSNLDTELKPLIINDLTTNLELSTNDTFVRNTLTSDSIFTDKLTTGIIVGDATGEVFIAGKTLNIGFDLDLGFKLVSMGADENYFPTVYLNSALDSNDWAEIAGFDYVGGLIIQTHEGASDTGTNAKIITKSNAYTSMYVDKSATDYSGSLGYIGFHHGVRQHGKLKVSTEYELELITESNTDLIFSTQGTGDVEIDSNGDIILDSSDGNFIAKKAGTEFSSSNSAYAGMILGYTYLQPSATNWSAFILQTSFTVEDATHQIRFIVPPSGKVEIEATGMFNRYSTSDVTIYAGLSDNSTYNSLGATYEYDANTPLADDESNDELITFKWCVTGLTAGTDTTYYIGLKSSDSSAVQLVYGYRSTHGLAKPPFIIKSTALPATIYEG